MADTDREYVIQKAREHNVRFVRLWFTDLFGLLKGIAINIEELENALDVGVAFDAGALDGFSQTTESDLIAKPDPSTFQILPWRPRQDGSVARMFCNILEPDGSPYEGDPRHVLHRTLQKAAELGFTFYVGPEIEFYYFRGAKDPTPLDHATFFDQTDQGVSGDLRRNTALILEQMGVSVKSSHHEHGPGQHEIDLLYTDALTMADNTVTTRAAIKEVAQAEGYFASFMPKPINGHQGSGMHVNQSLFQGEGNAFFSARSADRLSTTAKRYIAGLLRHAPEITLLCNQWVNSYKRLVQGGQSPRRVSWAFGQRAGIIRVPTIRESDTESVRVELRTPDSACNVYLAFAGMLAAGLRGIEKKYPVPDPLEDTREGIGKETLPSTLIEAVKIAERSDLLKNLLGEKILGKLLEAKRAEWEVYHSRVSHFEMERYLGML